MEADSFIDIETGVSYQCELEKHYLTGSRDGRLDFRLLLSDQLVNVSAHHIRLTSDATGRSRSFRFAGDERLRHWGQRLTAAVAAVRDPYGSGAITSGSVGRAPHTRAASAPRCAYVTEGGNDNKPSEVLVTVREYGESRRAFRLPLGSGSVTTNVPLQFLDKMAAFLRCTPPLGDNGGTVDCIRPMTSQEANEILQIKCHRHESKKTKRDPPKHATLDSRSSNDLPTIQGQLFWLDQCGQWIGVWTILKGYELTRSAVDTPLITPPSGSVDEYVCQPETIDVRTWTLSYNETAYGRQHCFELVRCDRRFGRKRCEMFSTKSEGEMRIWLHRLNNVVAIIRGEQPIDITMRANKKSSIRKDNKDTENKLLEKILKDRSRLRDRAMTIDSKINPVTSNGAGAMKYSSFTHGQDKLRKRIIEAKLNEISKCIGGDTVDGRASGSLKEKIEDLRFELDELDIKLSHSQYRKRGSVERRNGSRVNVSFQNDTNLPEHKRRSLLKSHALAFSTSDVDSGGRHLKRCISLGGAHNNRTGYNGKKKLNDHKDDIDHESLNHLENINNFEKLLHKMQITESGKW